MDANERRMVKFVESRDVALDWIALTHKDMTPSIYPTLYFSRFERGPRGSKAGHAQLFFPKWMAATYV